MSIFFVLVAVLIISVLFLVFVEHKTFKKTFSEVNSRYQRGDKSCAAHKTWYGWRVREYGDSEL